MSETVECKCEVDMEGYHMCASCAAGVTDPVDFLAGRDNMAVYDCDEPEY